MEFLKFGGFRFSLSEGERACLVTEFGKSPIAECAIADDDKISRSGLNEISFSVSANGKTAQITLETSAGVEIIGSDSLMEMLGGGIDESATVPDELDGRQYIRLALEDASRNSYQIITLEGADIEKIDRTLSKAVIALYLDQPADVRLRVSFTVKYANRTYEQEVYTGELTGGYNEIVWGNLDTKNWDVTGAIEYISLRFGELGDEARNDVCLGDITLYKAAEN